MWKSLLAVSFLLIHVGCASTQQYRASTVGTATDNPARVTIQRANTIVGAAVKYVVFDNGQAVGRLGPGGKLIWTRDAGYVELAILNSGLEGEYEPDYVGARAQIKGTFNAVEDVVVAGEERFYTCTFPKFNVWEKITPQHPLPSAGELAAAKDQYKKRIAEVEAEWENAKSINTVEAFSAFSAAHPNGPQSRHVMDRIHQLQKADADWPATQAANTIAAYDQFIRLYPEVPQAALA